jgi:rRNA-processing protein FCF1
MPVVASCTKKSLTEGARLGSLIKYARALDIVATNCWRLRKRRSQKNSIHVAVTEALRASECRLKKNWTV